MFAIWTHTDGSDARSALCRLLLWLLCAAGACSLSVQQARAVTSCINHLPKILFSGRTMTNVRIVKISGSHWPLQENRKCYLYTLGPGGEKKKSVLLSAKLLKSARESMIHCFNATAPPSGQKTKLWANMCVTGTRWITEINSRLTLLRRLLLAGLICGSVLHMRTVLSAEQLKNNPEEVSPVRGSSLAPGYIWKTALPHHSQDEIIQRWETAQQVL